MKKIKLLFLALSVITFVNCSSDDNTSSTTPTTITASGSFDWNAFNPATLDITALATINGEAASTYTVNAIKGDIINFTFNSGANKSAVKVKRELVFLYIDIDTATDEDYRFLESITYVPDPNFIDFEGNKGIIIGPNAPTNYDGKFDMYFTILEDGVELQEIYKIDPKIRIRASR